MNKMARIETGQAFLKARNFEAARREGYAVLKDSPTEELALELVYQALLASGDNTATLTHVSAWIAADPGSERAHQHLVTATFKAKGLKAGQAVLERYREAFPYAVDAYQYLSDAMDVAHGEDRKARSALKRLRKVHGEDSNLHEFEAFAYLKTGRFLAAQKAAKKALAEAPGSPRALLAHAVASYRLGRFFKARALARQLREVAPEKSSVANNIIFASYAVLFPPFLFAHLVLIGVFFVGAGRNTFGLITGTALFVFSLAICEKVVGAYGVPALESLAYWSVIGWCAYNLIRFPNPLFKMPGRKSVRLSQNY